MKRILPLAGTLLLVWIWFQAQAAPVLPQATAQAYLKSGALLLDVRTAAEFQSGHVTNAVNLPLDQVSTGISALATNKNQVLLLYCRSGRRSGMAERELHDLGYTNTFNLGSLSQAQKAAGR